MNGSLNGDQYRTACVPLLLNQLIQHSSVELSISDMFKVHSTSAPGAGADFRTKRHPRLIAASSSSEQVFSVFQFHKVQRFNGDNNSSNNKNVRRDIWPAARRHVVAVERMNFTFGSTSMERVVIHSSHCAR